MDLSVPGLGEIEGLAVSPDVTDAGADAVAAGAGAADLGEGAATDGAADVAGTGVMKADGAGDTVLDPVAFAVLLAVALLVAVLLVAALLAGWFLRFTFRVPTMDDGLANIITI